MLCILYSRCSDLEYRIIAVMKWTSLNSTRKQLGVDDGAPGFAYCSPQIVMDYYSGFPDPIRATTPYVAGLLERGVPVLIFAGKQIPETWPGGILSLIILQRRRQRLDLVRCWP